MADLLILFVRGPGLTFDGTVPFRSIDVDPNDGTHQCQRVYAGPMTQQDEQPRHPRKPAGAAVLRPDKTDAIVAAFYEELAESGHERLTMDRVAARAGVGKAALYRRWPSKQRMVADLVASLDGNYAAQYDRGSLRDDLLAYF